MEKKVKGPNLHHLFLPVVFSLHPAVSSSLLNKYQCIIFSLCKWLFLTVWLEEMDWLTVFDWQQTVLFCHLSVKISWLLQILMNKCGHSRGYCNPNQQTLFLLMCRVLFFFWRKPWGTTPSTSCSLWKHYIISKHNQYYHLKKTPPGKVNTS